MLAPFEWHRALTLAERLNASRTADTQAQATTAQPSVHLLRALDGLSPQTLRAYRAPDVATLHELVASPMLLGELEAEMPWLAEFRNRYDAAAADAAPAFASEEFALADALWPITTSAVTQVADCIRCIWGRHAAVLDGESLLAQARRALHARLFSAVSRALVVELAAAQATGLLPGDTPAERFAFFVECLRAPDFARSVLSQYPVLVRQAVTMTLDWRDAVIELLERFGRDRGAVIDALLDDRDPGALVELTLSTGDGHRGGRAVAVAAFADGRKVVYKPRSLAVDRHFAELVDWMNAHAPRLGLAAATVLDRGAYGWSEFVEARACASAAEAATFYRKQGANLALVQLLCGADLHSENVIACGDTPYLIDMEALFHPIFQGASVRGARRAAELWIGQSVLRTGLLPLRGGKAGAAGDLLDVSGMGNVEERPIPFAVPMWEDANSDDMRIVYGQQMLKLDPNLPHCDGRRFSPEAFAREIVDGYTVAFDVLRAHREELAHADGPLQRFRGDAIRVVVRATARYSMMLLESFHPDYLADAIDKERYFDSLWEEAADAPLLARLAHAERRDLWRGDVPVFTARTDGTAIWTSDGERIDGALPVSGLDAALARLAELSEHDLARQVNLIHAALASVASGQRGYSLEVRAPDTRPEQCSSAHAALATAKHPMSAAPHWTPRAGSADPIRLASEIGDWLADMAFRDGDRATWLVLRETADGYAATVPAGPDLYSGLAGIALFLATLAAVTSERRFAEMAQAALRELADDPALTAPGQAPLGAFDGLAGVIYALAHCAQLCPESTFVRWARIEAERLATVAETRLAELDELDVIGGHAGIVATALTAGELSRRPIFARLARKAGGVLLRRIGNAGAGSETAALGPRSFGHGAAGIAFALLRLHQLSGETACKDAALALLRAEPDCPLAARDGMASDGGWCRGEPGVALAYAAAQGMRFTSGAATDRLAHLIEGERAPASDCLCHGTLGNLWILQDLRQRDAGAAVTSGSRLATQIVERIARDGARCGTFGGLATPGLMDGLAGIGLALLRLSDPASTPNLLTLG